jgi:hypothetical protein
LATHIPSSHRGSQPEGRVLPATAEPETGAWFPLAGVYSGSQGTGQAASRPV